MRLYHYFIISLNVGAAPVSVMWPLRLVPVPQIMFNVQNGNFCLRISQKNIHYRAILIKKKCLFRLQTIAQVQSGESNRLALHVLISVLVYKANFISHEVKFLDQAFYLASWNISRQHQMFPIIELASQSRPVMLTLCISLPMFTELYWNHENKIM